MKQIKNLAAGAITIGLLLGASSAQAATTFELDGENNVIRINNLELNLDDDALDGLYNVEFINDTGLNVYGTVDGPFDFPLAEDAVTVAIQLNTALNLNNPVPTGASSAGSSEFFIPGIEYFGFWAGFGSEDPLQSGLWDGSLAVLNPDEISTFASFTPAVPVPAAVWLFGSGLLGLIGIARRKTS